MFFGLPAAGLSSAGFQLSVAMEQGFSAQRYFLSMFAQIICGFSAQMGFKNVFAQIILSFDLLALAMQSGASAGIDPDGFLF